MNDFNKKEYKYKLAYVCMPKENFVQIALRNRCDLKLVVRTFKYASSIRRFFEKFPTSRGDIRKVVEVMKIARCE